MFAPQDCAKNTWLNTSIPGKSGCFLGHALSLYHLATAACIMKPHVLLHVKEDDEGPLNFFTQDMIVKV